MINNDIYEYMGKIQPNWKIKDNKIVIANIVNKQRVAKSHQYTRVLKTQEVEHIVKKVKMLLKCDELTATEIIKEVARKDYKLFDKYPEINYNIFRNFEREVDKK